MISIAIIDDLSNDAEYLKNLLYLYASEHDLTIEVRHFTSGKNFLKSYTPDIYSLIFLDIIMKRLDGIETARQIRAMDADVSIVFTTAEPSYALEGYEVDASAFLIKSPQLEPQKLFRFMDKIMAKLKNNIFLNLSDSNIDLHLSIDGLCYVDVADHKLTLHTRETKYALRMSIEKLKSLLPKDDRFFECYRGIIINLDWVSSLEKQTVTLKTGTVLPVSRRRYQGLSNIYSKRCFYKLREKLP